MWHNIKKRKNTGQHNHINFFKNHIGSSTDNELKNKTEDRSRVLRKSKQETTKTRTKSVVVTMREEEDLQE